LEQWKVRAWQHRQRLSSAGLESPVLMLVLLWLLSSMTLA